VIAQVPLYRPTECRYVRADVGQKAGYESVGLVDQGREQVFAVHLGVAEAQRKALGVMQRLL
jgi:hypothetical protein